jgi:hypothetical protein
LVVESAPPEMPQFMTPVEFGAATAIDVSVSTLAGLEWRVGATPEVIFRAPGVYTFRASTVLESEEPSVECEVRYSPTNRAAG